jgi:hypothetical protein
MFSNSAIAPIARNTNCHEHYDDAAFAKTIGFKIINLGCVIGRRGIPIQLPPSILAKLIILKPIILGKNAKIHQLWRSD